MGWNADATGTTMVVGGDAAAMREGKSDRATKKRRVSVVLGGAGFIGSHLVERLWKRGDSVIVVDNMEYCYPDNLSSMEGRERFDVVVADVVKDLDRLLTEWEVYDYRPDEIYHLAGVVATGSFVANPVEAYWCSVGPMDVLLRYKRRNPAVKLLFASSSEVYGNAKVIPTPESYTGNVSFDGARSGYDEGKRSGEALITAYEREYGVGAARVRIFNTYGERMNATGGRLVPSMVKSALEDGVIGVAKPGTQRRTLLYVSDCVEALIRAMEVQSSEAINVGGNETMTVAEVADRIASRINHSKLVEMVPVRFGAADGADGSGGKDGTWSQEVRVVHVDGYPHDIEDRKPDITRAKEILGWEPTVPFSAGINHVVSYWAAKIERERAMDFVMRSYRVDSQLDAAATPADAAAAADATAAADADSSAADGGDGEEKKVSKKRSKREGRQEGSKDRGETGEEK